MGSVWFVKYESEVLRHDIPTLDQIAQKEVKRAIEQKLFCDPVAFGKPLQYSLKGMRSLRVGDYRIAYTLKQKTVSVFAIGHRKDIYAIVMKRLQK